MNLLLLLWQTFYKQSYICFARSVAKGSRLEFIISLINCSVHKNHDTMSVNTYFAKMYENARLVCSRTGLVCYYVTIYGRSNATANLIMWR